MLAVDAYMPRTKLDNRGSCPVADHIPKARRSRRACAVGKVNGGGSGAG